METQNKRLNFNTDETAEERENQKKQLIQFLKDDQYFFDVIKGGRHSLTNSVFLAKRFTAKEVKSFNDGFEVVRI